MVLLRSTHNYYLGTSQLFEALIHLHVRGIHRAMKGKGPLVTAATTGSTHSKIL